MIIITIISVISIIITISVDHMLGTMHDSK